MPRSDEHVLRQRLGNQHLTRTGFTSPAEVVGWLGAVQSQDYPGAGWGIGLRATGLTGADVDAAYDAGDILRTHILRPTWHFVTPTDIRWMLALSGPRVNQTNASMYRRLELDDSVIARSRTAFERALGDGGHLTRTELASVLRLAGIDASGQRLAYTVMRAELDGVICSGARRGRQFTYALLDHRAPAARPWTREDALAELTRRYFTSHGPATVRDFVWWSGLTVRDARAGIESVRQTLAAETAGGLEWWANPSAPAPPRRPVHAMGWLLPNYDEFLIAYQDRRLSVPGPSSLVRRAVDRYPHHLVVDGVLAGSWTRTLTADSVYIAVAPYRRPTPVRRRAIAAAAARYARFVGLPAALSIEPAPAVTK